MDDFSIEHAPTAHAATTAIGANSARDIGDTSGRDGMAAVLRGTAFQATRQPASRNDDGFLRRMP
jgi:hypothetical protein